MVIPMPSGMGGALQGDVPEALYDNMQKIKISTIIVFVSAIGKLATGQLPLNEIFFSLSGIFLLKEDKHTGIAYRFCLNTPIGACAGPNGGGLSCLMPLIFLGALNILFSLFSPNLLSTFNLMSIIGQLIGCFFGYKCYQYLQGEAGPTGALPGATYAVPQSREMDPRTLHDNSTTAQGPATNFVAFTGEGNKLGNA